MYPPTHKGLMLDTNVYNRVIDGVLDILAFAGNPLFATHIQLDELKNTTNPERKTKLVAGFNEIATTQIPTESMVWDVFIWDECKWPTDDLCERLFAEIRKRESRNKSDVNCWRDALIADTAMKNDLLLITDDVNLRDVVRESFGQAITISEFLHSS
jgi:hypothetical protein